MIWKSDNVTMKTPSSYKIQMDDFDDNSYRSVVNGKLIDTRIAFGMHSCQFSFDYLTEDEAETLIAETKKNPMNIYIKSPIFDAGYIEGQFRCSKRTLEMYKTGEDISSSKWKVSFNLVQKAKVSGQ